MATTARRSIDLEANKPEETHQLDGTKEDGSSGSPPPQPYVNSTYVSNSVGFSQPAIPTDDSNPSNTPKDVETPGDRSECAANLHKRVYKDSQGPCGGQARASGEGVEIPQKSESKTYLEKIRYLSRWYPHLRLLGDWMIDRQHQTRFSLEGTEEPPHGVDVLCLDFVTRSSGTVTHANSLETLKQVLGASEPAPSSEKCPKFLISTDMSREIVETLGEKFDIDPHFFFEHLGPGKRADLSDVFAFAPDITTTIKCRQWCQLKHVKLLHYDTIFRYMEVEEQREANVSKNWVLGGLEQAFNKRKDVVAIAPTRTTIWLGTGKDDQHIPVSIVLVDPQPSTGKELGQNSGAWLPVVPKTDLPSLLSNVPIEEPGQTVQTLVAQISDHFSSHSTSFDLVLPIICTICADWFAVCTYAQRRLRAIQWNISIPQNSSKTIDQNIRGLTIWREQIPYFAESIREIQEEALPAIEKLTGVSTSCEHRDTFADIVQDFKRIGRTLDGLQGMTNRLGDQCIAEMQIAAARQSLIESHNLARLTWMATIFIPLTFMTGLFSMTENLSSLKETFKMYFKIAIPLALIAVLMARWGSSFIQTMWSWLSFIVWVTTFKFKKETRRNSKQVI